MADLSEIRRRLKAWPSINDPRRYYVNDLENLIRDGLWAKCNELGYFKPMDVVRYAKVWFDNQGRVHVEGVYDQRSAGIIGIVVDYEFSAFYPSNQGDAVVFDWSEATDALPHDLKDQTYLFDYKGRIYYVNVTVYCRERDQNVAVRASDGSLSFESDSSDLWELVVELYKDGRIRRKESFPDMFQSLSSWDSVRPEPTRAESARNLSPDDPERVRVEGRGVEPRRKPEPAGRAEPESRLHRLTDEEIEQMSREAAAETTHPKTGWTKAEVMDVARRAGVPEEQLAVLSRMKLDEIRSTCLIYDGTDITGNEYNSMQQRHTKFYRLDIEYIKSFGDGD